VASPAPEAELEELLRFARALAADAAQVALHHFRSGVRTRSKPDGTRVTDADLAVEAFLIERLQARTPELGILSEECGAAFRGRRRWVLDPIDGTAWFARGAETWGTHIALEEQGEVLLGVVSRPATGQCVWAVRGGGAHRGGLDFVRPTLDNGSRLVDVLRDLRFVDPAIRPETVTA